jgi:hypothetical protein
LKPNVFRSSNLMIIFERQSSQSKGVPSRISRMGLGVKG